MRSGWVKFNGGPRSGQVKFCDLHPYYRIPIDRPLSVTSPVTGKVGLADLVSPIATYKLIPWQGGSKRWDTYQFVPEESHRSTWDDV